MIADEQRPLAVLFGRIAEGRGVQSRDQADRSGRDRGQGRAGYRAGGGAVGGGERDARVEWLSPSGGGADAGDTRAKRSPRGADCTGGRPGSPPLPPRASTPLVYEHDERAARADLRRQIAALEAELGRLFGSAFPRTGIEFAVAGPRRAPDALGRRARASPRRARRPAPGGRRAARTTAPRSRSGTGELIEEMAADPAGPQVVRVSNEDIGEPGCRHWHSRPRWGLLGMLMGWWRVRVSSGCPLAEGLRPPDDALNGA